MNGQFGRHQGRWPPTRAFRIGDTAGTKIGALPNGRLNTVRAKVWVRKPGSGRTRGDQSGARRQPRPRRRPDNALEGVIPTALS